MVALDDFAAVLVVRGLRALVPSESTAGFVLAAVFVVERALVFAVVFPLVFAVVFVVVLAGAFVPAFAVVPVAAFAEAFAVVLAVFAAARLVVVAEVAFTADLAELFAFVGVFLPDSALAVAFRAVEPVLVPVAALGAALRVEAEVVSP